MSSKVTHINLMEPQRKSEPFCLYLYIMKHKLYLQKIPISFFTLSFWGENDFFYSLLQVKSECCCHLLMEQWTVLHEKKSDKMRHQIKDQTLFSPSQWFQWQIVPEGQSALGCSSLSPSLTPPSSNQTSLSKAAGAFCCPLAAAHVEPLPCWGSCWEYSCS